MPLLKHQTDGVENKHLELKVSDPHISSHVRHYFIQYMIKTTPVLPVWVWWARFVLQQQKYLRFDQFNQCLFSPNSF